MSASSQASEAERLRAKSIKEASDLSQPAGTYTEFNQTLVQNSQKLRKAGALAEESASIYQKLGPDYSDKASVISQAAGGYKSRADSLINTALKRQANSGKVLKDWRAE